MYAKVGYGAKQHLRFRRWPETGRQERVNYELVYMSGAGRPRLQLRRWPAGEGLLIIGYPPLPSELVKVFRLCHRFQ